MHLITTAGHRRRRWGRVRGTIAVAALLLTALGALLSAVTGRRPVWAFRRIFAPVAATWRSAAWRPVPSVPIITIRTPSGPASEGNPAHVRDA